MILGRKKNGREMNPSIYPMTYFCYPAPIFIPYSTSFIPVGCHAYFFFLKKKNYGEILNVPLEKTVDPACHFEDVRMFSHM